MTSYKTHEIKYNQPKGFKDNANDLSIRAEAQVEVLGVDGVGPRDPKAEYTLEGDGTRDLKIRDIDKGDGETLKIRLKNAGRPAARLLSVSWTRDGNVIPKAAELLTTVAIDAPEETVLVVEETLGPVVKRLETLAVEVEKLGGFRTGLTLYDRG